LTPQHYFKSPQEMAALFADLPEALENTIEIARRCAFMVQRRAPILPKFADDEVEELRRQAKEGLAERLKVIPHAVPVADYEARLEFELGIIEGMGFPGYFLIVADFIKWAKEQGIPVGPGRGSGAGSLVAYALTITDLDPLRYNLLFERFLNPERVSMPDFDIDFCMDRREEVIHYVQEKYGRDKVGQIITFGALLSKAAVRDIGRVLQMPYGQVDRLSKMIPVEGVKPVSIEQALAQEDRLREAARSEEVVDRLLKYGMQVEGLLRNASTHAAGVVIGDRPLDALVPLYQDPRSDMPATQFNMKWVEQAGLVKFDFLGLKTLTVIQNAVEQIHAEGRSLHIAADGTQLYEPAPGAVDQINAIPLDDAKTYELYAKARTVAVFQVESSGMMDALKRMKPTCIEDIVALVALYRPGPMENIPTYCEVKNGLKERASIHPLIDGILEETQGIIVYQEQVMQIAQVMAGYSLGGADLLRRAMGKKKKEVLDKEYVPFSEGMKANGYNDASIAALWGVLVPFSDYAFNKAHTAAYGLVSYWTAYLKANYPAEYMAALLTSVGDDKDKSALYLNECRRMGIKVLPPSVNESVGTFAAVGRDIRFGLHAIRNVGRNVVEGIVSAREEKGAFTSFDDFLAKCPAPVCNKRTIESLIMGGAFDDLGHPRQGLVMVHEEYVDAFVGVKRQEAIGQDSLWDMFGGDDDQAEVPGAGIEGMGLRPVPDVEWSKQTKLTNEREMLGLYVSDHPLFGVEHVLQRAADTSIAALTQPDSGVKEGSHVTIAGLVTGLSVKRTKKGDLWAIATVEDLEGAIECLFFPKTYLTVQTMLTQDIVAVVRGRVNARDDTVSLYAEDLTIPEITDGPRGPVVLTLDYARATTGRIEEVKQVLSQHPGSTDVQIKLVQPGRSVTMSVDASYRVEPTEALIGDLKVILGARAVSA
jgi:DNA polymerase-3 subunit alpha